LRARREGLEEIIGSEKKQWDSRRADRRRLKEKFGKKTPIGKRRRQLAEAPEHDEPAIEGSHGCARDDHGRALRRRGARAAAMSRPSNIVFKQGDKLKLRVLRHETTRSSDVGHNGRFTTVEASKLPGGAAREWRPGMFIDWEKEADIVTMFRSRGPQIPDRKGSKAKAASSPRDEVPRYDAAKGKKKKKKKTRASVGST